jgi:ATP-binding cassette, subfamily A (ABC1), member 3
MYWGHPLEFFAAMILYGQSLVAMSMALSTLFTDSKVSGQIGTFIVLLPIAIFYLVIINCIVALLDTYILDGESSNQIQLLQIGYVFPHFSFGMIILDFFTAGGATYIMGLKVIYAWIALVLTVPVYLGLYAYLDAVIPSTYGIHRHWLFCCRKSKQMELEEEEEAEVAQPANEEGLMPAEQAPIRLKKMTRKFGKFVAVDKLSLELKNNEVLALLGHNGAGKTTTIDMLSGMLKPTSGDADVHGVSLRKDLDSVRKSLGLCQQFDVLFDQLTVKDHLKLACELKDVPKSQVEHEIREILDLVLLKVHSWKQAQYLSGGMKRKLSLGMALIGKPKIIILDEPTSGLDVDSRTQVWELIRRVK